jgi:hypothetical protein
MVARQVPKRFGAPKPCLRKVACGLRQLRVGKEYSDKRSNDRIPRVFEPTDLLNTLAALAVREAGFRSLGDAWADTTSAHGRLMLSTALPLQGEGVVEKFRPSLHGANGGAPQGNRNALKHGLYTAEAIEMRRVVHELTRQSREVAEKV